MWFLPHKRIYLDYASSTPILPEALEMVTVFSATFGNPGAIHTEGVRAAQALLSARENVARELACKSREVVFTSGGTEANNLAILGVARHLLLRNRADSLKSTHWIVSSIEHPSVLECFSEIERIGGKVTHIDPDKRGLITPQLVFDAMKKNTVLISLGWANHEIGVVQPLRDIVRTVREKNPTVLMHTDAGQAPLYLAPHVHTLDIDLMTLDSGKLYGPRGLGVVYVSHRAEIAPILFGGEQERGLRPGTENVALALGFAKAFELVSKERKSEAVRLEKLRGSFAREIVARIPGVMVNGDLDRALPHMLNISVPNIQSEYVTLALDKEGIAISTKSACREGGNKRSHVVEALGGESWRAENTLRFSMGRGTTARDLEHCISVLEKLF